MNNFKNDLLQSVKTLALALVLSVGVSYVYAWVGPTATPPGANATPPINASTINQVKSGGLGVSALISDTLCLGVDCIPIWPFVNIPVTMVLKTSGTWVVPADITSVTVTVVGGGGGGGGNSKTSQTGTVTTGGTGLAGSSNQATIAVTPWQVIPYVIGLGGGSGVPWDKVLNCGNGNGSSTKLDNFYFNDSGPGGSGRGGLGGDGNTSGSYGAKGVECLKDYSPYQAWGGGGGGASSFGSVVGGGGAGGAGGRGDNIAIIQNGGAGGAGGGTANTGGPSGCGAGGGAVGKGPVVNGTRGCVIVNYTGSSLVTNIIAGPGISLSGPNGNVTISTLQDITMNCYIATDETTNCRTCLGETCSNYVVTAGAPYNAPVVPYVDQSSP